eukprot:gene19332-biopygen16214
MNAIGERALDLGIQITFGDRSGMKIREVLETDPEPVAHGSGQVNLRRLFEDIQSVKKFGWISRRRQDKELNAKATKLDKMLEEELMINGFDINDTYLALFSEVTYGMTKFWKQIGVLKQANDGLHINQGGAPKFAADASEAISSVADAPEAISSVADASEANTSQANTSEANSSEADTPEADTSEADTSEADTSEAESASGSA